MNGDKWIDQGRLLVAHDSEVDELRVKGHLYKEEKTNIVTYPIITKNNINVHWQQHQ